MTCATTPLRCSFSVNPPATTAIYTLSLHDALPICGRGDAARLLDGLEPGELGRHLVFTGGQERDYVVAVGRRRGRRRLHKDRKSTRLNSSHQIISYAVFCLKKKKQTRRRRPRLSAH